MTVAVLLIQLVAAVVLAPVLPGLVQAFKAYLQGRPGPSPLQPYRELRRLWGKSVVTPSGTSAVYRWAPAICASAVALAAALVPLARPHRGAADAILLVGLLALARFAVTLSAWDTANGFGLMGASRDLTYCVFVEPVMLLAIVVVAARAHGTELATLVQASAGWSVWSSPAAWCALAAFVLVMLAETGRQPFDNPDTHLELTMVHEGPLLEYAGRDLALLHWAAAARHWIVIALAGSIFLPHPADADLRLALLPAVAVGACLAMALTETAQAKMRILLVPRLLMAGASVAFLGVATAMFGTGGVG